MTPKGYEDALRRDVALTRRTTAKHHAAPPLSLLHTVPGMGQILRPVLRYESPQLNRCPRGQEVASSARGGTCATEAGGQREGTSGSKIGQAHLKWAFSEAAVLFLRDHAAAQQYLARLEHKHGQGKALTVLAQKLARAVYYMLKRQVAFATETFFQR